MPRIFITGDTHRLMDTVKIDSFDRKIGQELTSEDYLIILGDFGGVWTGSEILGQRAPLDFIKREHLEDFDKWPRVYWEKKPYTVLFLDGNHENHTALDAYPVEEWCGGKVHKIYKNTIHLMRGQVYEICGRTFFTFGGAESTDKAHRKKDISWWEREMPSAEEYDEAYKNLQEHGNKVDYILTHCAPETTLNDIGMPSMYYRSKNDLTMHLDMIAQTIKFKAWYFGHYHSDSNMGKFHMLYNSVIELPEDNENG